MQTGFHFEDNAELFQIIGWEVPIILLMMAAALALEVFLALKKDRRLGLILPGLWLLWTLGTLATRAYPMCVGIGLAGLDGLVFLALLVENIPTLLLLIAYGGCRLGRRWSPRRQVEQTRIEDL